MVVTKVGIQHCNFFVQFVSALAYTFVTGFCSYYVVLVRNYNWKQNNQSIGSLLVYVNNRGSVYSDAISMPSYQFCIFNILCSREYMNIKIMCWSLKWDKSKNKYVLFLINMNIFSLLKQGISLGLNKVCMKMVMCSIIWIRIFFMEKGYN